jgi:hypothetical protein
LQTEQAWSNCKQGGISSSPTYLACMSISLEKMAQLQRCLFLRKLPNFEARCAQAQAA